MPARESVDAKAPEASTPAAPAGRGALQIGAAKAWFLVAGLAQNVLTPIAIGQAGFGAYKRSLAFINVLNNVVVVASIQAVSRAVAAAPEAARAATLRRAIALHALLGVLLAGAFFALIPAIVAYEHAPQLAPILRVLAVILVGYAIYAPIVGALNGARAFGKQAALDAAFSTTRTLLTAGVGYLFVQRAIASGSGGLGAAIGFAATALLFVPVALAMTPFRGGAPSPLVASEHLGFFGGLLVAQVFQSLLLQFDLVLLGRIATLRMLARGVAESVARDGADRLAGLYAQAQAFGLVPYQLLLAASLVLFPAIAAARARGDRAALERDVARGGAATVLVAGALVSAIAGCPRAVLRFAYGQGGGDALPIADAAPILRALTLAHAATALAMVGVTLLAASGRARLAAGLSACVATTGIAGAAMAAELSDAEGAALGAHLALGLMIGIAIGAAVVAIGVRRTLGRFVPPATLLRAVVSAGAALSVSALIPTPELRVLCGVLPLAPLSIYGAVLVLLGEPLIARLRRAGQPPVTRD